MQSLLAHYNIRHQLTVTLASCYAATRLIGNEIKPIALELYACYTSERAKRCYEFIILSAIALVWMTAYAAVWAGNRSREQFDKFIVWRDRFVASHMEIEVADAIASKGVAQVAALFAVADAVTVPAPVVAAPVQRQRVKGLRTLQGSIA